MNIENIVLPDDEAERRLKIIADLPIIKNGEYVITAGVVMQQIAKDYFKLACPVCSSMRPDVLLAGCLELQHKFGLAHEFHIPESPR